MQPAPTAEASVRAHWDQMQIINLIIINKQCWHIGMGHLKTHTGLLNTKQYY